MAAVFYFNEYMYTASIGVFCMFHTNEETVVVRKHGVTLKMEWKISHTEVALMEIASPVDCK